MEILCRGIWSDITSGSGQESVGIYIYMGRQIPNHEFRALRRHNLHLAIGVSGLALGGSISRTLTTDQLLDSKSSHSGPTLSRPARHAPYFRTMCIVCNKFDCELKLHYLFPIYCDGFYGKSSQNFACDLVSHRNEFCFSIL